MGATPPLTSLNLFVNIVFITCPCYSGFAHQLQKMSAKDSAIVNETVDDSFVQFLSFIKKFEREYRNMEEFQLRYQLFCDSLKKIDELNKAPGQTATFGITHFADRTEHERSRVCGLKKHDNKELKTTT